MKLKVLVAQSCVTLGNHMDCNPPGSSVYGFLLARVLKREAIPLLQGIFLTQGPEFMFSALQSDSLSSEMGVPEQFTCLLRNLYAGQEATVRTKHGTMDWFKIGKGVHQGCILSPWLNNQKTSCEMLGWMNHRPKSRLPGEIAITSDRQGIPL